MIKWQLVMLARPDGIHTPVHGSEENIPQNFESR